jgi:hypothetical protein
MPLQELLQVLMLVGPLTRMPMTHGDNCAEAFVLTAADLHAQGQTSNVVDGPDARILALPPTTCAAAALGPGACPSLAGSSSGWCGWPSRSPAGRNRVLMPVEASRRST